MTIKKSVAGELEGKANMEHMGESAGGDLRPGYFFF